MTAKRGKNLISYGGLAVLASACGQIWQPNAIPQESFVFSSTAMPGDITTTSRSNNIWTVTNSNGLQIPVALTQNTALALDSTYPTYSPDGKKITFQSLMAVSGAWNGTPSASTNIWIMNSDGSALTPITQNTIASDASSNPQIANNGKIYFSSYMNLRYCPSLVGTQANK